MVKSKPLMEKSKKTFIEVDGERFSIPGDMAKYESDGQMTLLGRGSVSINSGGEKIFPEEVEMALKAHPNVFDCLVVGMPDERFGQKIVAVVSTVDNKTLKEEKLISYEWVRGRFDTISCVEGEFEQAFALKIAFKINK